MKKATMESGISHPDQLEILSVPMAADNPDVQNNIPVTGEIAGARILLVEDNEINLQVVWEFLEKRDVHVTAAVNGLDAVDKVKHADRPFDAVLMDIQMPVMNGFEATQGILSMEMGAKPPIIALTAHVTSEERQKCLDIGMVDYLRKPVNPAALQTILLKWINRGRENTLPEAEKAAAIKKSGFPESMPGLDILCGLEKVDHDERLYLSLLEQMESAYAGAADEVKRLFAGNDMERAYALIHSIKGVSGNLGANDLHRIACDIQKTIQTKTDFDDLSDRFNVFEDKMNEVMGSIRSLVSLQG